MRSLLTVICFIITLSVFGQRAGSVSVVEFGAVPDSHQDATVAIAKALAYCKKNSVSKLIFPKGQYDLYTEKAIKKEYFITNTSTEEECPSKIKTIGLLLEGMNDFTIEGNGALLLYHGKMISFVIDNCHDITIKNLAVDYARPTMSEFTIVSATNKAIEAKVHPDSWYKIENDKLVWYGEDWRGINFHCIRMDTSKQMMFYANDSYKVLTRAKITQKAPQYLKFEGEFKVSDYPVGNVFTVRDPIRDQVGAFIAYSKDIKLKNLSMHYMHGLGIVNQFTENISIENVFVEPKPGSGRHIASFADGLHFSGCKGKIEVLNCRFDGLHDDPINVHGTHLKITSIKAPNQIAVKFMHGQTYGMKAFFKNDSIAFVNPATLEIVGYGIVQSVTRVTDREISLTLKKPVPENVSVGQVVENITWTPDFSVRYCIFKNTNTRGLLVTTRRKVVIENNLFNRVGMHAILISNDASSWYESGPVKDMIIRNNTFNECGYNSAPDSYAIAIVPENHEMKEGYYVHRNIRIENNKFNLIGSPLMIAKSTDELYFIHNQIRAAKDTKEATLQLQNCRTVFALGNLVADNIPFGIKMDKMERRQLTTDSKLVR